jgi:hypothetical protein
MIGKDALYANAARTLSDAKRRADAASRLTDYNTLEDLDAFLLAFENPVMNPYGVSHSKRTERSLLFIFYRFYLGNKPAHRDISKARGGCYDRSPELACAGSYVNQTGGLSRVVGVESRAVEEKSQ